MLACATATPASVTGADNPGADSTAPDTGADMDASGTPVSAQSCIDYNKSISDERAEKTVVNLGDAGIVPPLYGNANGKKRALMEKCNNSVSSLDSQQVPGTDVAIEEAVILAERKEARQERRFKRKKSTCAGCIGDSPSQKYCVRFGGCCYYDDDDDDSDVSSNYSEKVLVVDTDTEVEEHFDYDELGVAQDEMTLAVNRDYIERSIVNEAIESEQDGEVSVVL